MAEGDDHDPFVEEGGRSPLIKSFMGLVLMCSCYSDLKQILHEESCNRESEGWQFVRSTEHAEIWRKSDENSPIQLIKVRESL